MSTEATDKSENGSGRMQREEAGEARKRLSARSLQGRVEAAEKPTQVSVKQTGREQAWSKSTADTE